LGAISATEKDPIKTEKKTLHVRSGWSVDHVRDNSTRIGDCAIYKQFCTVPKSQTFGGINDEKDGKHLDGDDNTLDRPRFLRFDEVRIVFIHQSLLGPESLSDSDRTDDFFRQCCPFSVMIQRPFLVLLHNHGGDDDGDHHGRDDANEDKSHFPLFHEGNDEGGEEHGNGVD
jgi:hypothetical protein